MLPPERAQTFANAPLEDLLSVLLRQLKRPLASHGFALTDAQAASLAQGGLQENKPQLLQALQAVVAESEAVLAAMNLSFQASLDADMSTIGGWETTSEFLEIANEKSNAELRITLGSSLILAFGGRRDYGHDLLFLAQGDYGDETIIARRVLAYASHIDLDTPDWPDQIQTWIKNDPILS